MRIYFSNYLDRTDCLLTVILLSLYSLCALWWSGVYLRRIRNFFDHRDLHSRFNHSEANKARLFQASPAHSPSTADPLYSHHLHSVHFFLRYGELFFCILRSRQKKGVLGQLYGRLVALLARVHSFTVPPDRAACLENFKGYIYLYNLLRAKTGC